MLLGTFIAIQHSNVPRAYYGRSLLVVSVSIAGVISLLGILPLDAAGPAAWGEEVRIVKIVRKVRMVRKVKIVRKVGKVRR